MKTREKIMVVCAILAVGFIGSIAQGELVANWNFDEGDGTVAYDSVGGNNGTLVNGASIVSNVGGGLKTASKVLSLDGIDDYVNIGNSVTFDFGSDTDFTVSAWVKTVSTQRMMVVDKMDYSFISGSQKGFELLVDQGKGQACLKPGAAICNTNTIIADGQWHLITMVAERKGYLFMSIYADGMFEHGILNLLWDNDISNTIPLAIGRSMDYNGQYFNGLIDDVRIYNNALSQSEIQSLVPEPATLLLLGLGGLSLFRRKR